MDRDMYGFASNFAEVDDKLGSRDRRKVGNNTYLERRGSDAIALKYHATDVLTFEPDGITFDTGGWYTVTTKVRFRDYAPGTVYSERGVWYYAEPGAWANGETDRTRIYRYWDGLRVDYLGTVTNPEAQPVDAADERKAIERDISRYVSAVKDALPLDAPSGGDCWYCVMRTEDGTSLGDATGDTSHLISHMEEGYVVPSLVFDALRDAGYRDPAFIYRMQAMEANPSKYARDTIGRAVRKYLRKRLVTVN